MELRHVRYFEALIRQTDLAGIIGETAARPSADLRVCRLRRPHRAPKAIRR